MKGRRIDAVVFDMDGIMFDSERIVQYSWDIVGEKMGYGKLGHHIYHTMGLNVVKREAYFKSCFGDGFPFAQFCEEYRKVFQAYVDENGLSVKEGLYELLRFLKEENIKRAVATSSSHDRTLKNLKGAGILEDFQAVITGGMVAEAKPSPEIYLKACAALEVPPDKALALEDSYNGIRSAHDAGMKVVMIPDLLTDSSPVDDLIDAKLGTLSEVARWMNIVPEN
ncbi:HAD family hydrolase [Ruminococcus gauvreauii]|uniref:HAD family phosphatase n=1 Tax=Ruminococcus gauvreauii TaxID=438033 RepID=A0ABY5VJ53_9FIRM|nr:HAD family phosphatase [Ruminococcus gauvreauii]UWP60600.1 HAD family phosphatase [Ruminococcus gauvreauii]